MNVSVEDVNEWEPRFRHPRYEFHAATSREGSIVGEPIFPPTFIFLFLFFLRINIFNISIGKLEAADGDRDDKISLSLRGPDARYDNNIYIYIQIIMIYFFL